MSGRLLRVSIAHWAPAGIQSEHQQALRDPKLLPEMSLGLTVVLPRRQCAPSTPEPSTED